MQNFYFSYLFGNIFSCKVDSFEQIYILYSFTNIGSLDFQYFCRESTEPQWRRYSLLLRIFGRFMWQTTNRSKWLHAVFFVTKWLKTCEQTNRLDPANIYLFKVNNRNTTIRWKICSKITTKTPELRQLTLFWCFYW